MVMSSTTYSLVEELRANLLTLATACPFDQCNPADCPLFPVRQMKPRARTHWLQSLPEADLIYLATYHQVCLSTKVEAKLAGHSR